MRGRSSATRPGAAIIDRWKASHGLGAGALGPEREGFQAHRLFTGRLTGLALPLGSLWLRWQKARAVSAGGTPSCGNRGCSR